MKEEFRVQTMNPERTRNRLERFREILNNKVKILLAARGMRFTKKDLLSDKDLNAVLAVSVSALEHMELEILVGEIRHLNERIMMIEKVIKDQRAETKLSVKPDQYIEVQN